MPEEFLRSGVAIASETTQTLPTEVSPVADAYADAITHAAVKTRYRLTVELKDVVVQFRLSDGETWTDGDTVHVVGVHSEPFDHTGIRFQNRVGGEISKVNYEAYS